MQELRRAVVGKDNRELACGLERTVMSIVQASGILWRCAYGQLIAGSKFIQIFTDLGAGQDKNT